MTTYPVAFLSEDVGLALDGDSFVLFEKLADGTAPTNAAPAVVVEIGHGLYRFDYTAAEDVVFVLDGGEALDAATRYVRGVLSPMDERLDVVLSTRASQAALDALENLSGAEVTALVAAEVTGLDVAVSTRASQASVDALSNLSAAARIANPSGGGTRLELVRGDNPAISLTFTSDLTDKVIRTSAKRTTRASSPLFSGNSYAGGGITVDDAEAGAAVWQLLISQTHDLDPGEILWDAEATGKGDELETTGTLSVAEGSEDITPSGDVAAVAVGDLIEITAGDNVGLYAVTSIAGGVLTIGGFDGWTTEAAIAFAAYRGLRETPISGVFVVSADITR